jgi:hypothetical protein
MSSYMVDLGVGQLSKGFRPWKRKKKSIKKKMSLISSLVYGRKRSWRKTKVSKKINNKNETIILQLFKNLCNYFWIHFKIYFRPHLMLDGP